ncbi:GNAT family N-acetyltransferase [Streptomyces sp. TP-A0356]|uniref:GNAT family N-acetyltransferase n=1 Tax=Streptomyces sp. TP-A0356 TaxID=1359208 RepID=UPI00099E7440
MAEPRTPRPDASWTTPSGRRSPGTDPAHGGRGLATRLVRGRGGIRECGDIPFPHASATNARAIRRYESIGFTPRRRTTTLRIRTAGTDGAATALRPGDVPGAAPRPEGRR